jgi:predicted flap endonuclease-1-like 5' DNA nuclease
MTKLILIEGIGGAYEQKLKGAGIISLENLREKGATTKSRKELAEKTGISDALILKWVNRADLFRIKGIGKQYSDLLEAAGVDTVPELAQRKAENLIQKMTETNAARNLVKKLPTLSQVAVWIEQAKQLPRLITY